MPVVNITLNVQLPDQALQTLVDEVTAICYEAIDASCRSVLVSVAVDPLFVNASSMPAVWLVYRSATQHGIDVKRALCRSFWGALARHTTFEPGRVFLQFSPVAPEDAWNVSNEGPQCVSDRQATEWIASEADLEAHATPQHREIDP